MPRIIPASQHARYVGQAAVAPRRLEAPCKQHVVILGAGEQGGTLGYSLARQGRAITFVDISEAAGREAAEKIRTLVPGAEVNFLQADLAHPERPLIELIEKSGVVVGAAHYALNPPLSLLAVQSGAHYVDMGGSPAAVMGQFQHALRAMRNNCAIIPNLGLAPGLAEILVREAYAHLDKIDKAIMRVGGLPLSDWDKAQLLELARRNIEGDQALSRMRAEWGQAPNHSFHNILRYMTVFSMSGLINEYTGEAFEIQDGNVVLVPALSRVSAVASYCGSSDRYEASPTRGTNFPQVFTYDGRIATMMYETYRYAGHMQVFADFINLGFFAMDREYALLDGKIIPRDVFRHLARQSGNGHLLTGEAEKVASFLGLLGREAVEISGRGEVVTPRQLFEQLAVAKLASEGERDKIIMSVQASGWKDGQPRSVSYSYTPFDAGVYGSMFSEMSRLTSFPIEVVVSMLLNGQITNVGAHGVERFLPGGAMIPALAQRGINIRTHISEGEEPVSWHGFTPEQWVRGVG